MKNANHTLEDFLGEVLRGVAKILGCNSTSLILINETTQELQVRVGTMAVSYPVLSQIENLIGSSFSEISVPIQMASDSLIYRCWLERSILETASLSELVGRALPQQAVEQIAPLVGDRRFICVPALNAGRNYGVLLFDKTGLHPFSRQQRQVLLRHARSIGDIIKSSMVGQSRTIAAATNAEGPEYILFSAEGNAMGHGPIESSLVRHVLTDTEQMEALKSAILNFEAEGTRGSLGKKGLRYTLSSHILAGRKGVLCQLDWVEKRRSTSLEDQLLRLTLGDPAPTLFVDSGFRITSCNEATERLFGATADSMIGEAIGSLFRDPNEIVDILGLQSLDPLSPYCEETTTAIRRDGTLFPSLVRALLLVDDENQVVGFLVLVKENRQEATPNVEQILFHERLASMGEMAAQLVHEIRNPLVAIGATLESLLQEEMADEQEDLLRSVVKEINRMDMVLKDYMAGRHELSFAEVKIAEVVADAKDVVQGARGLASQQIVIDVDPKLSIVADYDAMKHVFFNLFLNALDASPKGGIIRCHTTVGAQDISVAICDQGPGLNAPPAQCLRPFFTTKSNGTGLGLAVCNKIAKAHGGLVELRNGANGGCEAAVVLPQRRLPNVSLNR